MIDLIYAVTILLCIKAEQCATANTSKLIEHTRDSFMERMLSGKMSFIYFGNQVNPTIGLFLEQLKLSADALEDYGIAVAKVNCTTEKIDKFCMAEKLMKKVYLFRGSEVLRSFDTDTVFDVNAIVSHVLFTVLFNEVRYVHTLAELLNIERAAKGTADIVFSHIQVLGLPEHRALMEAAFVYGAKYQFVLTTGGPVLKHMGVDDPASLQAGLWFLHCKGVSRKSGSCPHTLLRRPLTTLNIYTFLQLMEAPLVMEATVDPSEMDVVHSHLNVPVLFLFSQAHTLALDRVTAETLAWRLRGEVGLVLIHRDSPDVKTPLKYNAAYRLTEESSAVKYFTLKNIEEVVNLFRENNVQEEEEEDGEDDEDHWAILDVLDDEVAESVYRDRDLMLDLEPITELTADTFTSAVAEPGLTVVLFYVKWDAVSMAFMQSYIEVADALEGVRDLQLASVDCGEWTDVCTNHQISSFPMVMLYRGETALPYRGMLGTESLHRFILLSQVSCPLPLFSSEEVLSFMEGELYYRHATLCPVRVLGLFNSRQEPDVTAFEEAARALCGEALLGLFADRQAERWAEEHSVKLPAILVSRGPGVQREAHSLRLSSPEELVTHIQRAVLDTFPELTVENLPSYLALGKPLLLLFVGDEGTENAGAVGEMRSLSGAAQLDPFLPCWIHLGRTPVGWSVLEMYLGVLPQLPALVLSQLGSGGEVFHFPPQRPLRSGSVLQWLRSVKDGEEQSAGLIPDEKLGPPVPFYDFLSIMDQEVPGYAAQRKPKMKRGVREGEEERGPGERRPPGTPLNSPAPHQHSEL